VYESMLERDEWLLNGSIAAAEGTLQYFNDLLGLWLALLDLVGSEER
jgi:hypothetical protein